MLSRTLKWGWDRNSGKHKPCREICLHNKSGRSSVDVVIYIDFRSSLCSDRVYFFTIHIIIVSVFFHTSATTYIFNGQWKQQIDIDDNIYIYIFFFFIPISSVQLLICMFRM